MNLVRKSSSVPIPNALIGLLVDQSKPEEGLLHIPQHPTEIHNGHKLLGKTTKIRTCAVCLFGSYIRGLEPKSTGAEDLDARPDMDHMAAILESLHWPDGFCAVHL
ncbi:hypothetical protein J6590_048435 [Homalodisca vitripennis]|nr:hypothetical protein J6590_048435 [Homalodisca vitripennis]